MTSFAARPTPAQVTATDRTPETTTAGVDAPVYSGRTQLQSLPKTDSAGRFSSGRSRTKTGEAAAADDTTPILYFAGDYGSAGYGSDSMALADVNGDGKPDLVVACADSGFISVLLGNGDGTFQPAVTYGSGGSNPASLAIGDVNGDGKLDVVVANSESNTVGVLLGNGDGTFQPAVTYASGGGTLSVALGDMNGDGKLDLVVTPTTSNSVGVMLGNGDGTFHSAVDYGSGGSSPIFVTVADVNGDGKLDLLVANSSSNSIGVLLGNGNGTLQPVVAYASGGIASAIAVADVNGDHKLDLLVANSTTNANVDGTVGVLLGNGDGTFQSPITYDSGGNGTISVAAVDLNADGRPDLIVANPGISYYPTTFLVGVLLGNGDGTFQPVVTYDAPGGLPTYVAVADLNGDGKPDIAALGNNIVNVFLNNAAAQTTTISLVSSVNPVDAHRLVTYTATVASQSGGPVTGTVTFLDNAGTYNSVTTTLTNNQATYTNRYFRIGTHEISATYAGNASFGSSTSATLTEYVRSAGSRTVLTTSGSPSLVGQPVTFTAIVTPVQYHGTGSFPIPDGEQVTFYDGAKMIGTGNTASGIATFTTSSLSGKTHVIKATYVGDTVFIPSTGTVQQVVELYSTTTALSSSVNPSAYKQAVTFTATVTSAGPAAPTGKVKFIDGTTVIGIGTLSGGGAALTKANLATGTHSITAIYEGDSESGASTSPILNQVVN